LGAQQPGVRVMNVAIRLFRQPDQQGRALILLLRRRQVGSDKQPHDFIDDDARVSLLCQTLREPVRSLVGLAFPH